MMKPAYLTALLFVIACNNEEPISKADEQEFTQIAQAWHSKYMQGSKNLEEILSGLDQDIAMWENGKVWTYQELEQFGPHLPEKEVIETYSDQKLLGAGLGYDYMSHLYVSSLSGDTLRETSSCLWRKKGDGRKIIRMNNLIKKESD